MVGHQTAWLWLVALLCLWGCAGPKKTPPPPLVLGLTGKAESVEATLHSVIIPGGPDSWFKGACWDEYVVTISNEGTTPLTIAAASLEDIIGQPQLSTVELEVLGKTCIENWKAYRKANVPVTKEQFEGAVTGAAAAPLLLIMVALNPADLILLPFALVSVSNDRKKIEKEFGQRNLACPLVLEPGTKAMGSLFFPLTAGPRRLVLKTQCEGRPVELAIPLDALAQLHLVAKL